MGSDSRFQAAPDDNVVPNERRARKACESPEGVLDRMLLLATAINSARCVRPNARPLAFDFLGIKRIVAFSIMAFPLFKFGGVF